MPPSIDHVVIPTSSSEWSKEIQDADALTTFELFAIFGHCNIYGSLRYDLLRNAVYQRRYYPDIYELRALVVKAYSAHERVADARQRESQLEANLPDLPFVEMPATENSPGN